MKYARIYFWSLLKKSLSNKDIFVFRNLCFLPYYHNVRLYLYKKKEKKNEEGILVAVYQIVCQIKIERKIMGG